jgi:hypothetical protein
MPLIHIGGAEVQLHKFLTWALDEVKESKVN